MKHTAQIVLINSWAVIQGKMRALGRKLGQAKRMLESGISTALKSSSVASCSTSGRDYSQVTP